MNRERVDVLVLGAGTAGAAVAALCAERGLEVLCVERRGLDEAGARWVNAVPGRLFDRAGLPRPAGDEAFASGHGFHLVAGWGPARASVPEADLYETDMRALVARLQTRARNAGARLRGRARAVGIERAAGGRARVRVEAAEDDSGAGDARGDASGVTVVDARLVVDATGLRGAGLLALPPIDRAHLCAAAQRVCAVRDAEAARAFLRAHGAREGEALAFTGVAGGYSVVNVRLVGDRVALLAGSIPAGGHPPGAALLDAFAARAAWIGPVRFGGARAIPLRRPRDTIALGGGRLALVGDAASQVFPAHGSGVGAGLVAARTLADVAAGGGDAEDYAVRWMRAEGGTLAAYDAFRRWSERTDVPSLARLIEAGVIGPRTLAAGLEQAMPRPDAGLAGRVAAGSARAPRTAAGLVPVLARMATLAGVYAAYPPPGRLRRGWARAVAGLFGERPDGEVADG